jgi:predicted RNase H-like HicB family nuclease
MARARYERLSEDGTYYGESPGFPGVWANTANEENCRRELQEVLEDWLLVGLRLRHPLPIVDGIDLNAAVPA